MVRIKWVILVVVLIGATAHHAAAAPIGETFGLVEGEYRLRHVSARSRMLNSVGDARRLIQGDIARRGHAARGAYDTLNFFDPEHGRDGHFTGGDAFPGDSAADDQAFAVRVRGWVEIADPGEYTFGVTSDDGFRLRMGPLFMRHHAPRYTADSLQTVSFDHPGRYRLKLTYFEQGNGAELELYAAKGAYDTFGDGALPAGVALPPAEVSGPGVPEPATTFMVLATLALRLLGRPARRRPAPTRG